MFYKRIATTITLINLFSSVLAQNWTALGEQLEILDDGWSVITTIYNDGDSALYVGGKFTQSDNGEILSKIAKWDGQEFHPVGCGFNYDCENDNELSNIYGVVASIIRFQDTLYAAGSFQFSGQDTLYNIAKFDGTSWHSVGNGFDASVNTLTIVDDTLYACGSFSFSGSTVLNSLAKWNGVEWVNVHEFPQYGNNPNSVADIKLFQDHVYVSGNFGSTGTGVDDLVYWDGDSWEEVGGGFFGGLMGFGRMGFYDDMIVFSGSMSTDENSNNPGTGVVGWNGSEWFDFDGGTDNPDTPFIGAVLGMNIHNNRIYVAGNYSHAGDISANQFAFWEEDHWCSFVDTFQIGGSQTNTKTSTFFQDTLYVIGGFNGISGNNTIKGIAKYLGGDICEVSKVLEKEGQAFSIYPNPAKDLIHLNLGTTGQVELRIFDNLGRQVMSGSFLGNTEVSVSELSEGVYNAVVFSEHEIYSACFIKE